ncbi:MAG: NIL domain-containing protein [Armatimonadetes bacterium]|nr:NIL domain-containing protein [Armatimonadota bacterium]
MDSIRVQLNYPLETVHEPLLYHLVTDYDLIPDIRRARIDVNAGGFIFMELSGASDNIEQGLQYLRRHGVDVGLVGLDGAEDWSI